MRLLFPYVVLLPWEPSCGHKNDTRERVPVLERDYQLCAFVNTVHGSDRAAPSFPLEGGDRGKVKGG